MIKTPFVLRAPASQFEIATHGGAENLFSMMKRLSGYSFTSNEDTKLFVPFLKHPPLKQCILKKAWV